MTKTSLFALSLTVLAAASVGCSDSNTETPPAMIGASSGSFTVYSLTGGAANPAMNIAGSAKAFSVPGGNKMKLELTVSGLPANTDFGSHLHIKACDDGQAGGHYQHSPAPDKDAGADAGGPQDPAFANATNEAWLDFKTDASGASTSSATVDWKPAAANAKSIIVHAMKTGTGGVAGPKLACLPFAFD